MHTIPPSPMARGKWMAGAGGVAAALASYGVVTMASDRVKQESVKEAIKIGEFGE